MDNHIHTPEDGRGLRDVYLDGRLIRGCFYADVSAGLYALMSSAKKISRVSWLAGR